MSFAFGFGGDDIDSKDDYSASSIDGVKQVRMTQPSQRSPRRLDLREMLASLPSQISYSTLKLDQGLTIYRRSLFDMRAQLMAEANPGINDNEDLLSGLDSGDLTSGIYEGGFKTWECAIDLAEYVASRRLEGDWHIIELGAGSAIPSCVLIAQAIRNNELRINGRLHFTLCDYNEDVLQLCTAPNVFLNANHALHQSDGQLFGECDIDLEKIDTSLLVTELASRGITFDMISGGWGVEFSNLATSSLPLGRSSNILVLASETIYSPESLQALNETLIASLKSSSSSATALVAAKQIYFGVGGGVEEFTRDIQRKGVTVKTVAEFSNAGVGRVILEVGLNSGNMPHNANATPGG